MTVFVVWIQDLFGYGENAYTPNKAYYLENDVDDANVEIVVSRCRTYLNGTWLDVGHHCSLASRVRRPQPGKYYVVSRQHLRSVLIRLWAAVIPGYIVGLIIFRQI